MNTLKIKDLHVKVDGKAVLNGVSLTVKPGEVHALMGPNGSGKSTLANVIAGHPNFKVTKGDILYDGKSILKLKPHERALLGIFLAFQYPKEIHGVTLEEFLLAAYRSQKGFSMPALRFRKMLHEIMANLKIPLKFAERQINVGFSGGEKKKAEILQLAVLSPTLAILDETDSGLDVDALKVVANGVQSVQRENAKMSVLVVTHYPRILKVLKPNHVHVLKDGKIVESGDFRLAHKLERKGYEAF